MHSQTILIPSVQGQVGSYLTDRFCHDNRVIVLDNTSSPCRHEVPSGVQLVVGDIQGPEAVRLVEKDEAIGKVFNAGTGKQTSVNRLAKIVKNVFNSNLPLEYHEPRAGDIRHSVADISAASTLGFVPKVSLEEGLAEFVGK